MKNTFVDYNNKIFQTWHFLPEFQPSSHISEFGINLFAESRKPTGTSQEFLTTSLKELC